MLCLFFHRKFSLLYCSDSLRNVDIVPASGDIHANDVVTCTGRANPPAQITLKVNVEGVAAVKAMNSASLKIQPAWVGRFILVDCTATADNGAHKHSLDTTTSYTVLGIFTLKFQVSFVYLSTASCILSA